MGELSEKSFPWDAEEVGGKFDRVYYADDWMRYFAAFISSGTFLREPTNLQVIANGDMTVTLKPGSMIIDGSRYDNIRDIIITLDPADGVLDRIDRISISWIKSERDTHYVVRQGEFSYNPVPAECRRTAEYKDYIVADILVRAGAIKINQTDITDQRLNSDVCGLAIPFAEINTKEIFLQLQDFYDQTVATQEEWEEEQKETITAWFEEIRELLNKENELHEQHKKDLNKYFTELQKNGYDKLATITQQIINFRDTKEADFMIWFDKIKGIFETDSGGKMLETINSLVGQVKDLHEMLISGMVRERLLVDEEHYLTDDMGNPLLVEFPICKCQK
ncbi:MAG: hypothetical protein HDR71_12350 [Lachnospiraceae bacterium]|nr:hypothetical protein [Lachnospiraceae bacterium]